MTDRGAIESIADGVLEKHALFGNLHGRAIELSRTALIDILRDGLDRLAADGYSVVKTELAETLYAELRISAGIDQAFLNGYRRCLMEIVPSYRPAKSPDAQAVLEGREDA